MTRLTCCLLLMLTACVSSREASTTAPTSTARATSSSSSTSSEQAVLRELNAARENPKQYAEHLNQLRQQFNGKDIVRGSVYMRTQEGSKAVDEAIKFLRKQKPIAPMSLSPGLTKAARDHAREQSKTGDVGHVGNKGSTVDDRVKRYGTWLETVGENIAYGYDNPRDIVMQLIIDDGVKDRGHRKAIFNPKFRRIGIANGTHPKYRFLSVHVMAGDFKPKN